MTPLIRSCICCLLIVCALCTPAKLVSGESVVEIWENDGQADVFGNPEELAWIFQFRNNSDIIPAGDGGPQYVDLCGLRLVNLYSAEQPNVVTAPDFWEYTVEPGSGGPESWDVYLWVMPGCEFFCVYPGSQAYVEVFTYRSEELPDVTGECTGIGDLYMAGWFPNPPDRYIGPVGVRGDLNMDGQIDLDDFPEFVGCVGGPVTSNGFLGECQLGDLDGDQDVDLEDFGAAQSVLVNDPA